MRDAFGRVAAIALIILNLGGCTGNQPAPETALVKTSGTHVTHNGKPYSCGETQERGIASIYTVRENGTRTSSGIPFRDNGTTVAHKTLPMGTVVAFNKPAQNKLLTATVTDRGPFVRGRILDLTPRLGHELGMDGIAPVEMRVCTPS